jgi:hypothetical protein
LFALEIAHSCPHGRNAVVTRALELADEHASIEVLLMVDADSGFEPETVARLLRHPGECVGATFRRRDETGDFVVASGTPGDPDEHGAVVVPWVSQALCKWRISALRRMRDEYRGLEYVMMGRRMVGFFDESRRDGKFVVGDVEACRRFARIGGECRLLLGVETLHCGRGEFRGTFK